MKAFLDTNFFISGFSERPKDFKYVRQAADRLGIKLAITSQAFKEIRWYLRREIQGQVEIVDVLERDLKRFANSFKKPESALPQLPDLSLIYAATKSKGSIVVSSDFKLIQTIKAFKFPIEGIVGSAFMLKMIEEIGDLNLREKLKKIRERIYSAEVRYSIERQQMYDPLTRIQFIEEQALQVLREINESKAKLNERTLEEGLLILDFIEEIKDTIPGMFEDFRAGKYFALANELEDLQNEIERQLTLSSLTMSYESHRELVEYVGELILFLYYLEMLCYIYVANSDAIKKAFALSEESMRLLMFTPIEHVRLKASVYFLRIFLAMLMEKFDEMEYFYGLWESLVSTYDLEDMITASEGFYVAMQIFRDYMGGFSLQKTKIYHPEETCRFLGDVAQFLIVLGDLKRAQAITMNLYKIAVFYKVQKSAVKSIVILYQVNLIAKGAYQKAFNKVVKHALNSFKKKGWDLTKIEPIIKELDGEFPDVSKYVRPTPVDARDLPHELRTWMDALSIVEINNKSYLIVRNWEIQGNIAIGTTHHKDLLSLRAGHKVFLVSGELKITKASEAVQKEYNVALIINPKKNAEISLRGEFGFINLSPKI